MTIASLQIELASGTDTDPAIADISKALDAAGEVEKFKVSDDSERGLAEIASLIAVSVMLIDQGSNALESIRKFVATARALLVEVNDLKTAILEVNGRKVDVLNASDEEIAALAEEAA